MLNKKDSRNNFSVMLSEQKHEGLSSAMARKCCFPRNIY